MKSPFEAGEKVNKQKMGTNIFCAILIFIVIILILAYRLHQFITKMG